MAIAPGTDRTRGTGDHVADTKPAKPGRANKELPKILPWESLGDYSTRVNAAIPITRADRKAPVVAIPGVKVPRTKQERKRKRFYEQVREEHRRLKERKQEELELAAERDLENNGSGFGSPAILFDAQPPLPTLAETGKRKRRRQDDDPWEELKRQRAEPRPGLHDVALAPPEVKSLLKMRKPLKVH